MARNGLEYRGWDQSPANGSSSPTLKKIAARSSACLTAYCIGRHALMSSGGWDCRKGGGGIFCRSLFHMGFSSDISPNTKSLPNVKFGVVVFNRGVVLLVMLHSGIVPCGFSRSTNTVMFPKSKLNWPSLHRVCALVSFFCLWLRSWFHVLLIPAAWCSILPCLPLCDVLT